jgi:superfamily II DNA or RNA helicase
VTRTYGTYTYRPELGRAGIWELRLEPAAAIRAKRLFGRVVQGRAGTIVITHTLEVARDILWFTGRWPLRPVDTESQEALEQSAAAHVEQEATIHRVLTTTSTLTLPNTPLKTPRDYQLKALELLRARHRYLLTDEVGLGKTLTGLLNLVHQDALPALIVPPAHLPSRWMTELRESMPWLNAHVAKTTTPPQSIVDGDLPDVLIVPYSKLNGWRDALAGRVRSVVFDEVQDLRRGIETQKGSAAAHVSEAADYVLGLTATPVYNYGGEVWQLFNILAPGELGTSTEFSREWGAGQINNHIKVANPAALGSYLREQGLMLGRTRAEVGRELPKAIKVPELINTDPTALAAVAGDAAAMARLILSNTSTREERFRAAGDLDWKLREATGIAKAPYVAEYCRLLLESEKKLVLFGWHRAVYEIWNEMLTEFKPVMYTGTESLTQKTAAEEEFKSGDARILIMSLRSGAGIDGLQKASSVAVFGELDWSPQVHEQAIGRLRRDGMDETSPVVAYFLNSAEGSDPALMEALQIKRNQAEPIVSPDGKLLTNATQDFNRPRHAPHLDNQGFEPDRTDDRREPMSDWKEKHATEASASIKHELVEGVIEEFMGNVGLADKGLPAYGIRKVAHYAAMVARAHALGFDPNLLRMTNEEATSEQLKLAATAVTLGVPVHMIDPESGGSR